MGDVLTLRDVAVRRGGRNIVDGLTWDVNAGEHWVILGPNGAGKTTVVQLISGRMHPTRGQVAIIGERLGGVDLRELRPLVGLTSAALDQRIPPGEKVLDVVQTAAYGNLARWREQYDEEDTRRAEKLLGELGVAALADRSFATLSSGERKRVGIARALMPNPEVLVLDEPASGLDLGGRESLLLTLTALAGDPFSPATVLVTHHVEDIPQGFTHVMLLADGRLFAAGPIEEILTSANLSALFGIPLTVARDGGRFSARANV
ncbi:MULTISPECIES: ABC transporter ATP-binding protein [unclassified Actinobaculum]|uniref:ABC transporter ATP-binding protein n=1 Tax=unclassified Actinobaculum TaxID=2609299 RepID=UPI000D526B4D|nr:MULTISPECIES: ABC transporter ATP-binding protein [unclassified Actinobaculum]AWE42430.1 ABC transporter ATP-binding protein [Actinobaculum sp. 313]RTE48416.1 ABC transporter ATP-binding protein [Actinobaculum sp. 352]